MARLYADENFPRKVVEALRQLGHDILTAYEAGKAGQAIGDEEVLYFAIQDNRSVLTLNRRDFIRLHLANPAHAGIIVCTQDSDANGQAERIHMAILSVETRTGRLVRVNRVPRQ